MSEPAAILPSQSDVDVDPSVLAQRCATMLAHPTAAVAIVHGGRIDATNEAWRTLFALPADVSVDCHVAALFSCAQAADRCERDLQGRFAAARGNVHAVVEYVLTRRDGSTFVAEVVVWPLQRHHHERTLSGDAIWQVRDVTADRSLHDDLRALEDYHRELGRHQWEMTFVIDRKGRLSYASPSVEGVLGFRVATLLGENFATLLAPGQRAETEQWLRTTTRRLSRSGGGKADGHRLRVVDHAGGERVLICRPRNCFDVPQIAGMVVHARDITTEPADASPPAGESTAVETLPAVDPLTALIGRVDAERRLAARIGTDAPDRPLLVLLVDLDRLRDINDRHGHAMGDRVIATVAEVLVAHVPRGDAVGGDPVGGDPVGGDPVGDEFVARVGGDEFLVVLRESDAARGDAIVQAILDGVATASATAGLPRVEVSIGIARSGIDGFDAAALWRQAELAMREAKTRGRGQAVAFHPRQASAIAARTALGAEIEDAIANGQLTLFYQPQVALQGGRLVGLEALLRWQHPTRGLLLPQVFIDAAIERGLIDALTKAAFSQVCDQIVAWQKQGDFPDVPVSVNVSARQFHDRRLPALVAAALLRSGLPARLLILELSEQHLVVDGAATERVVRELSLLGVRIAIGSFGLNHASLRALRQLRVSQIKLDRGFVEGLPDDAEAALVVEAAIEIGRRLRCQVIAEGVETRRQFECLRQMGCEAGQGFHFGAPLSASELQAFIDPRRDASGG